MKRSTSALLISIVMLGTGEREPCERLVACIASVREKAAGIKWERELSEIEVDAGTPEGERTPAETYAFQPEYVPEVGSLSSHAILVWTRVPRTRLEPVWMGK